MTKTPAGARQRGFSLIEIMVGVMVGLIGCIVMFQVYSAAETRKRSVASGSDMDISGRLGLMTLERDVQLAGYGIGAAVSDSLGAVLNCSVAAYDSQRPTGANDFAFPLVPVLITNGANGAPDTIATLRGSSSLLVGPKIIDGSTATTKRVKTDTGGRTGMLVGDLVIASQVVAGVPSCAMFQITGDTNPDTLTLDHADGARYNKPGGIAFGLVDEGHLYNLGASPARNSWTVQGNKLVVTNDLASSGVVEAADLIIDLQAQYGVDGNNDGMIAAAEWTETAPADWKQLLAVRFALLARSTQYEPEKVTTNNPRWSGAAFVMRNLDGTADSDPGGAKGGVNNWRNYRYNVFEAVVPVRNALIGRQL